jgi:hypothetical protein
LQPILLSIVVVTLGTDIAWSSAAAFDIDRPAYLALAILAAIVGAGSIFYGGIRRDEKLNAMLFGTFFLIAFSASFGVLNYFLLTVAGARIDQELARIDRMAGIDWRALMRLAEMHPLANRILNLAYISTLPQIAILVNCLGLWARPIDIYKLCLSIAIGAAITVAVWTVAPSFGAFSVYPINHTPQFALAVDFTYARDLLDLLSHGPSRISPFELKGLIAFPSFHSVLAVFTVYYGWKVRFLRYPALMLNLLVLASIPIQGGHHVIDIAGGLAVAMLAIAMTNRIARQSLTAVGSARGSSRLIDLGSPLSEAHAIKAITRKK